MSDGKIGSDIVDENRGDFGRSLTHSQFLAEPGSANRTEVEHDERIARTHGENRRAACPVREHGRRSRGSARRDRSGTRRGQLALQFRNGRSVGLDRVRRGVGCARVFEVLAQSGEFTR